MQLTSLKSPGCFKGCELKGRGRHRENTRRFEETGGRPGRKVAAKERRSGEDGGQVKAELKSMSPVMGRREVCSTSLRETVKHCCCQGVVTALYSETDVVHGSRAESGGYRCVKFLKQ